MPWNWQGRDSETSQSGSPAEARIAQAWPDYEAKYLAERLKNPKGKYTYDVGNSLNEFIYLDKITENYKEEADASLKAEFVAWLQGTHTDNVDKPVYINGGGKPKRIHMTSGNFNGQQTLVGQTRDDWVPTSWGQKQLTHLNGVREFLRSQAEGEARSEYYMNLLAEYGPQDLESAWMYFKHWVKGRPVGNDLYLNTYEPEKMKDVMDGMIRSPGFSMAPEDKPDMSTLANNDFADLMGFPVSWLTAWYGGGDAAEDAVTKTYEVMKDKDARKDKYAAIARDARTYHDRARRDEQLRYEHRHPQPRERTRGDNRRSQAQPESEAPAVEGAAAPSAIQPEPQQLSDSILEEQVDELIDLAQDMLDLEVQTPSQSHLPRLPHHRNATPHTASRFHIPENRVVRTPNSVRSVNSVLSSRRESGGSATPGSSFARRVRETFQSTVADGITQALDVLRQTRIPRVRVEPTQRVLSSKTLQ